MEWWGGPNGSKERLWSICIPRPLLARLIANVTGPLGVFTFIMSVNICTHFRKLTDLSLPMIVNALIQEAQYTSTMIFVGQLGKAKYLGAATLGNMLCNITGYSLAFGSCLALDTLIAQAYGAKAYALMGLHAQRAAVIMTLFAIPVAFIWWETEWIVHNVLGIDRDTSRLAGYWAHWILLGLWPTLMFQVLRKLLQACGIIWPIIASSVASTVANVLSSYVTIYVWKWGFMGAAVSVSVAQWAGFLSLALIIYLQIKYLSPRGANSAAQIELSTRHDGVKFSALPLSEDDGDTVAESVMEEGEGTTTAESSCSESEKLKGHGRDAVVFSAPTVLSSGFSFSFMELKRSFVPNFPLHEAFPEWSAQVWQNWGVFLELGMPGAFSLFLEWGSYELMAMISGRLGTVALATHGVFMSTCAIIYMVPQAIADATAVIAGNFLGHGDPAEAKSVIALGLVYDMAIGLCGASVLLFVLRPYWGAVFSSDPVVQHEVYATLPIMFVYITVDSMKCIAMNTLRSTGRPQVTMVGNIFCCAGIMLPLGWYLAITRGYGLWGVWGAMSVGWLAATLLYLAVLWFTDWDLQAKEAARRISMDTSARDSTTG